jgi:hypothetical protein
MNYRKVVSATVIKFSLLLMVVNASAQTAPPAFRFKPVVRAGDPAPVPPQIGSILNFSFNDQAQVALIADGGIILKSGDQVTPIVGLGDPAPGGGMFFNLDVPSLGPQGQVIFRGGTTAFPGTSGLFEFANGTITSLLTDGTIANTGESITPQTSRLLANGDLIVANAFGGSLYRFSHGVLTRLVGTGDPAPGGGIFSFLQLPAMNSSGQIAFQGFTSTGADGIFLFSNGVVTKIITSNDVFPDGVPFGFPESPAISDSGQVVFGGLSNSVSDSGLFSFANGQLTILVPRTAPLPNGTSLDLPTATSVNNAGQIAFAAITEPGNDQGQFLYANGQISSIAVTGQTAPDGGVFNSGDEGGGIINNAGQVLFVGTRVLHGPALYLFSSNQLQRVIGQGDTIPRQPTFAFPTATGIGSGDLVLISDSTFPGGNGGYTATPARNGQAQSNVAIHIGQDLGADGVVQFLFGFSMNQHGQVAAGVSSDARGTITVTQKGTVSVINDSGPNSTVAPEGTIPSINDKGEVAFVGVDLSSFASGIYLNSKGQTQLLLPSATPVPGGGTFSQFSNMSLNNLRQLAFMGQSSFGATGIFFSSNGSLISLATDGGAAPGGGNFLLFFLDPRLGPVIDNRGDVAFASLLTGTNGGFFGSGGVFLFKNGVVSRIVGPNDPSPDGGIFLFADAPSINSQGDVAFFAETSNFNFGAFVYSNGTITQVAVAGDFVNNEGLGFVDLPILNDNGHVAFTANLFDGSNAIFVAAPADDDDPSLAEWAESTRGTPQDPKHMKEIRDRNNFQLTRGSRHGSPQNQKPAGPSNH